MTNQQQTAITVIQRIVSQTQDQTLKNSGAQAIDVLTSSFEDLMTKQRIIEASERQLRAHQKVYVDHLTALYLYYHFKGVSNAEFKFILSAPSEMLITPFINERKNRVDIEMYKKRKEFAKQMDSQLKLLAEYDRIESRARNDLQQTKYQLSRILKTEVQKHLNQDYV